MSAELKVDYLDSTNQLDLRIRTLTWCWLSFLICQLLTCFLVTFDAQSPRTDSHDSLACLWEGERRGWEKEREQLAQQVMELREELKDCRASERLRSSAEKQVSTGSLNSFIL